MFFHFSRAASWVGDESSEMGMASNDTLVIAPAICISEGSSECTLIDKPDRNNEAVVAAISTTVEGEDIV
jgi:hypothetical protein